MSETAGWIVKIDGIAVRAAPTLNEAQTAAYDLMRSRRKPPWERAVCIPADAADLDALDLPPSTLGIERDGLPWWRTEPEPERPPDGPEGLPVYLPAPPDEQGERMHAWSAVTEEEERRSYLGIGRVVGEIRRERTYSGETVYFDIGRKSIKAVASDDVSLPIVEEVGALKTDEHGYQYRETGGYLPHYPHCPDCQGRLEWAEAGRVPGSRRCAGLSEPDRPAPGVAADPPGITSDHGAGCGSTYVDTRYGYANPVPGDPGEDGAHGDTPDIADDTESEARDLSAGDDLSWHNDEE